MMQKVRKFFSNLFYAIKQRKLLFILLLIYIAFFATAIILGFYYPANNQKQNTGVKSLTYLPTISDIPFGGNDSSSDGSASQKSSKKSLSGSQSSSFSSSNYGTTYVAFYSDSQSDTDEEDTYHANAVNRILATGANPIFHAGDLMEDGTLDSLNRFNAVTATLRATRSFYAAQGNNERNSPLYFDNFTFPGNERWYSINVGPLHMVILDSAYSSSNPSQIAWLKSDLSSPASQTRITGVMFHHPIYPNDPQDVRTIYAPIFTDYGVDFVVQGHNHSYSKSYNNGVYYFVTTGQTSLGYCTARVYSDHLIFTAYNSNGLVIESTTIYAR